MFTGLVEEIGRVDSLIATDHATRLRVAAPRIAAETEIGDSIAVNGCCLTIVHREGDQLTFELLQETLDRTNLGALRPESGVNLERALAANGRIGGHFVQGHVDCAAHVVAFAERGADRRLEVELPQAFARYVVAKGSIALNGISLTIAEVLPKSFVVWIIPHTFRETNLRDSVSGDLLNIEFDLLAKYVERMVAVAGAASA